MAGSGVKKRSQLLAIRAFKLRQSNLTNREIAELVGKPVESIPSLIKRGERLTDPDIIRSTKS